MCCLDFAEFCQTTRAKERKKKVFGQRDQWLYMSKPLSFQILMKLLRNVERDLTNTLNLSEPACALVKVSPVLGPRVPIGADHKAPGLQAIVVAALGVDVDEVHQAARSLHLPEAAWEARSRPSP